MAQRNNNHKVLQRLNAEILGHQRNAGSRALGLEPLKQSKAKQLKVLCISFHYLFNSFSLSFLSFWARVRGERRCAHERAASSHWPRCAQEQQEAVDRCAGCWPPIGAPGASQRDRPFREGGDTRWEERERNKVKNVYIQSYKGLFICFNFNECKSLCVVKLLKRIRELLRVGHVLCRSSRLLPLV